MVTFWDVQLDKAIARTKMRIKLCEKHGKGDAAMVEKRILERQKHKKELRK